MIAKAGLGLRFKYIDALLTEAHSIEWLELLADHFHDGNAPIVKKVEQLRERFPCALHSVNLSLASPAPLNKDYLASLTQITSRFDPAWISDHLCFSNVGPYFLHDLLPFSFTHQMLDHIAFKIDMLQGLFKKPFLIENISTYARLKGSEMTEAEFIRALTLKTGCGILLDVNNIVVSCHNHSESITEYYECIPFQSVHQIHLAGATSKNGFLIDTHSKPVNSPVWQLYQKIIAEHGAIPTCLEWDFDLPEFDIVKSETDKIDQILTKSPPHQYSPIQAEFDSVLAPTEPPDDLIPQSFLQALKGQTAALDALTISPQFDERLDIYKTSIIGTLQQTLYKTFKPLEALLGLEAFQELCFRYAASHFSKDFNLNRYGEEFGQFAMNAPYAEELPYLGDFIHFCYLWQQTYLRPELGSMTITSPYPLYEIWQRCQPEFKGNQIIENWQGPFSYLLRHEKGKVLVTRQQ